MAYACLTGELPFAGETFGAVCLSVHNGTLVDPSEHRPGLPAALDAWFRRALNRTPEERFGSAAEMSTALSAAVVVDSTDVPLANTASLSLVESPTLEDRATHPERRRPRKPWVLKTVVSLVVVSALVFGALGSWDPGAAPDWSIAARMGRAFAGALGRRATSFANSGPETAPSAEPPRILPPLADANAPRTVFVLPEQVIRPDATSAKARRLAPAREEAPIVHAAGSAWTARPSAPEPPPTANPSPSTDDPYGLP